MRKFRVIALSVGGMNNKVYKSQDVVNEDNFPEGNADKLVKGKFLKELTKAELKKEAKAADDAKAEAEAEVMQAQKEKVEAAKNIYEDLEKELEVSTKLAVEAAIAAEEAKVSEAKTLYEKLAGELEEAKPEKKE